MVDPINFTNFNRSYVELEETALFSVLVAGKNALTTAKALENFLNYLHKKLNLKDFQPFYSVRQFNKRDLASLLRDNGIGCQTSKSRSIYELANSNLNLKTCSVADLERIHGIGPKTARMFVMHTRENQQYAVLDVHILRYLRDCGHDVPRSTPVGKKYREIELIFLELARKNNKTPADFDLMIWRRYRRGAA